MAEDNKPHKPPSPLLAEANAAETTEAMRGYSQGWKLADTGEYQNPFVSETGGLLVLAVRYVDGGGIFVTNPRHAMLGWKSVEFPPELTHEALLRAITGANADRVKAKIRCLPGNQGRLAMYIGEWSQAAKEFQRVAYKVVLEPLAPTESIACSLNIFWHIRAVEGRKQRKEKSKEKSAKNILEALLLMETLAKK
jgi:hypothetical protein